MAATPTDLADWMRARRARIDQVLDRVLPSPETLPARLHAAMRYAALNGGKRMRPLLAYASGELAGASDDSVDRVAAAVELIHSYSLVHDDLPCMDDDVMRRGKPTCHVAFDQATALLVGDSLQSLAFQLLAEAPAVAGQAGALEMVALLAVAAGSRGMAGGQAIDLESVGKSLSQPELEAMHMRKTGALIRAAVLLGARCGPALAPQALADLGRFAQYAGLAFQVIDDVLDVESDSVTLGKSAGKDARQHKPTYVSVLGASAARDFAEELRGRAQSVLQPFGARGQRLSELTDCIVLRKS